SHWCTAPFVGWSGETRSTSSRATTGRSSWGRPRRSTATTPHSPSAGCGTSSETLVSWCPGRPNSRSQNPVWVYVPGLRTTCLCSVPHGYPVCTWPSDTSATVFFWHLSPGSPWPKLWSPVTCPNTHTDSPPIGRNDETHRQQQGTYGRPRSHRGHDRARTHRPGRGRGTRRYRRGRQRRSGPPHCLGHDPPTPG